MKEGQEHIYYMPAPSWEEAVKSPYLEAFRAKDFEVLIMLDEVDDLVMSGFTYKEKHVKSIVAGDVDLDKSGKAEKEKAQKKYQKLIDLIKEELADQVKDVRLSGRLKDSACLLVADEGGLNPQMEKILKAMGQDVPESKRILEINPDHPLFAAMNEPLREGQEEPGPRGVHRPPLRPGASPGRVEAEGPGGIREEYGAVDGRRAEGGVGAGRTARRNHDLPRALRLAPSDVRSVRLRAARLRSHRHLIIPPGRRPPDPASSTTMIDAGEYGAYKLVGPRLPPGQRYRPTIRSATRLITSS